MKVRIILMAILLAGLPKLSVAQPGNYIILLNGEKITIDLGEIKEHKTKSGEVLSLQLLQPEILTYSDKMISFQYYRGGNVTNTEIAEGIEQCMFVKASGNGFMIQKYETLNPTMLTNLMVNELTKESLNYGYTMEEEPVQFKIKSGEVLEGIQATLTYKGENEVYTVTSYGEKDEGIIVVTMLLSEEFKVEDQPIIDLLLNSLEIKD